MFLLRCLVGLCLLLFPLLGKGQEQTALRHPCLKAQVDSLARVEPYVTVVYNFLENYGRKWKIILTFAGNGVRGNCLLTVKHL